MFAILTSVLIAFGLVPAGAKADPCLMPAWALPGMQAFACDFKDVLAAGKYTGRRTGARFHATFHDGPNPVLLIESDRVVPLAEAQQDAAMIGAQSGWIDGKGQAHGAYNAWILSAGQIGPQLRATGTLVAYREAGRTTWP